MTSPRKYSNVQPMSESTAQTTPILEFKRDENGTPMIVAADGSQIGGYVPPAQMLVSFKA